VRFPYFKEALRSSSRTETVPDSYYFPKKSSLRHLFQPKFIIGPPRFQNFDENLN
jgi:hypothetical protein